MIRFLICHTLQDVRQAMVFAASKQMVIFFHVVLLDIPIGNIRENSFSTIWLNSPILEELNNRQKYSEPCVQCIYVEKCGGCRGVAYGSFGDYFAPDPHCWLDSNGERL